jgi:hypothetical protein
MSRDESISANFMLPVDEFSKIQYIRANSEHSRKLGITFFATLLLALFGMYTKLDTYVNIG